MKTKVYLDLDLTLLANEKHMANYAHEFLEKVVNEYGAYWLSTRCRGDATETINGLRSVMPPETLELAKRVKPTNWVEAKTEAIDFSAPFLWFDDELYDDERAVLEAHGVFDNLIQIDLSKNPDQLRDFLVSFPLPVTPHSTATSHSSPL